MNFSLSLASESTQINHVKHAVLTQYEKYVTNERINAKKLQKQ